MRSGACTERLWSPRYGSRVLAVFLVALSVGLDNFGAATAIGVSGIDGRLRLRIALIFGVFEAAMPVLGLLLGNSVAHDFGSWTKVMAGSVLGLAGVYAMVSALRRENAQQKELQSSTGQIVVLGAALSIDNVAVGFALGAYHVNILVTALVIASVSVALTLVGLEIGTRLGQRLGARSELVGGAALILVGAAVGTGLL
jgi:manganese efflux pump family protein